MLTDLSLNLNYLSHLLPAILSVPINADQAEVQPIAFETSDGRMVLAFSTTEFLADFFETPQNFTEIAPQAFLAMAEEDALNIGFDLGQEHGVILDQAAIADLRRMMASREIVDEVKDLQLESFPPIADLDVLADAIPLGVDAWLLKDKSIGMVLLVEGDESAVDAFQQAEIRKALFLWDQSAHANFLWFPKQHPKLEAIRAEVEAKGQKLVRSSGAKPDKPPILRF